MTATVTNFSYGVVTPIAAYLMATVGSALGLRCTTRSLRRPHHRGRWLALGSVSFGCGIWAMHFIAMIGFDIKGVAVRYDRDQTFFSLAVVIICVAAGMFLAGYRGRSAATLITAGIITGNGVVTMHGLGMSAIKIDGSLHYDGSVVILTFVFTIVIATAALWAAVSIHSLWSSMGASLIMGVAVTGMHYIGMTALTVRLTGQTTIDESTSNLGFLMVMLAGPLVVLLVATTIVMFDTDMLVGDGDAVRAAPAPRGSGSAHPVR
ncbi:MHYT domain-containing protein [Streptomyces pseudovenezuelae]|uniref:NO-binding membrane sensor protein with MHYT domain n=1 Tax=Streptomyces pseudovenezuelae TaxID=67350 RepID=A0ABT6LT98_9ACTN|nr:MHYT domain-containing protein [Streptomyces pseudovenezuelae]MDH6219531.1 NO-binding membrane sensor protein with MHYT domain [Streptomyces pseudovenezuelae]